MPGAGLTVTIKKGDKTGRTNFRLTVKDDAVCDRGETIVLEGTYSHNGNNNTKTGTAELTIDDNDNSACSDTPPSLTLTPVAGSCDRATAAWSDPQGGYTFNNKTGQTPHKYQLQHKQPAQTWQQAATENISSASTKTKTFTAAASIQARVKAGDSNGNWSGWSNTTTAGSACAITLTANPSPRTLTEDAGNATVAASAAITGGTYTTAVTVTVALAGTADSGDYTANPASGFTITIPAGQTSHSRSLALGITDDTDCEGDETITLTGTAGGLTATPAEITITDNDTCTTPPTGLTLTATPATLAEDSGPTTVTLTAELTGGTAPTPTTVTVAAAGTATKGTPGDYTTTPATGLTITIPANQTTATATVAIAITDDTATEGDETIQLTATALGLTATAAITITDNETCTGTNCPKPPTAPGLTSSPATLAEDSGSTTVTLTAELTGGTAPTTDTTVTITIAGIATLPGDYTASGLTITISAGQTTATATLDITITDDADIEGTETIQLTATALGLTATAAITIADNDCTGANCPPTPPTPKPGNQQPRTNCKAPLPDDLPIDCLNTTITRDYAA